MLGCTILIKLKKKRYYEKLSDPHYSVGNGESALTAKVLTNFIINLTIFIHYMVRKIVLGDYSFYGFSVWKTRRFYKEMVKTSFTVIMEYHGYRCRVFYLEKYVNVQCQYIKDMVNIKGGYEIMDLFSYFGWRFN
jgi:hypothetical protein